MDLESIALLEGHVMRGLSCWLRNLIHVTQMRDTVAMLMLTFSFSFFSSFYIDDHFFFFHRHLSLDVTMDMCPLAYLEHVQVVSTIAVQSGQRKNIRISLTSPQGTVSDLLPYRSRDNHKDGFHSWPFMTVFCWGEEPQGVWSLKVETRSGTSIRLDSLELVLFGTEEVASSVASVPGKCHAQCVGGCAGPGPQHCDACKAVRLESSLECAEACPEGTFADGRMCRPCPPLCAKCADSQSCSACVKEAALLPNGVCEESCPSNYYVDSDGACHPCHTSCLTCEGPGEQDCLECPGKYILDDDGSCVPSCSKGYYLDHRKMECRSCHKTCAECVGGGATDCTLCKDGYDLLNGTCVKEREKTTACEQSHFFSEKAGECVQCSPGCEECTDDTSCSVCADGFFLEIQNVLKDELRVCVNACAVGFYGDDSTTSCQPCPAYCDECVGPDNCTVCSSNSSTPPHNGRCPQPCSEKQYFDHSANKCLPCSDENCLICISSSVSCLQCVPPNLLTPTGLCVSSCPKGLSADMELGTCVAPVCHSTCLTCTGPLPDQCTSCPPHLPVLTSNGSCGLEQCPDHMFLDLSSQPPLTCKHCHASCAQCHGPAHNECMSCPPGFLLSLDHQCVACPPYCRECETTATCSVCQDGYFFLPLDSSCLEVCPVGHFDLDGTCHRCGPHCNSCLVAPLCYSCEDGFVFYEPNHTCLEACPAGYYSPRGKCLECEFPCSSCRDNATDCVDCIKYARMDAASGECQLCCNPDLEDVDMCCDCDATEVGCVWIHSPTVASGYGKLGSSNVVKVLLPVFVGLVSLGVTFVGLLALVAWCNRRHGAYKKLEQVEEEAVDDEEGSNTETEVELFSSQKTDKS